MEVTYFRPRKPGPELQIENAVVRQIASLFPQTWWAAGSLPLGAGHPDLVLVKCEPEVFALADTDVTDARILAYLRAVRHARLETIADRTRQPREQVQRSICGLIKAEVVSAVRNIFRLSGGWRCILPEVVSVEAKVANWQKAVEQAARNSIFSHQSYVALPSRVAAKVRDEDVFSRHGVGVISVDADDTVSIVRQAVRRQPRVWTYYYQLAYITAANISESKNAICRVDCGGSGKVP